MELARRLWERSAELVGLNNSRRGHGRLRGLPPGPGAVAGLWLVEDPNGLPRAYLAHARCVAGPPEALRRLGSVQAPSEVVVACAEPLPEPPLEEPRGEVTAARFAPERVDVEVRARGGEVLVLNDAYYGGWTASVDGEPVPILPANGAVRAVVVPPGEHQVVFRYRTPGLVVGAGVSLGTLLVLLGADGVLRRRLKAGYAARRQLRRVARMLQVHEASTRRSRPSPCRPSVDSMTVTQ